MRYAIPLLTNRISPRCTIAECLLLLDTDPDEPRRIIHRSFVSVMEQGWLEMLNLLVVEGVDILVCGGISRESRGDLAVRKIDVIHNVAATATAVVEAIAVGALQSGYGFDVPVMEDVDLRAANTSDNNGETGDPVETVTQTYLDCLACSNAVCLHGGICPARTDRPQAAPTQREQKMLEAALDLICEQTERNLCRLSEVIYYGLEMNVRRMGVAFCWDLAEPTRILVDLLRRFFEVVPVGCKIRSGSVGSGPDFDPAPHLGSLLELPCNPLGQATALGEADCDLNVMVGLCVGADSLFAQHSAAPVTTLFVKDRSLANNPIGAIYSDYYLREAMRAATGSRV